MAKPKRRQADELAASTELRIVGGQFRGRKLKYEPFRMGDDPVTRPMKHRLRESIFNLVSTEVKGKHAIDLFAGTGALGLEALSRGAVHATFIERHVPTARVIEENIKALGVEAESTLLMTSAFLWAKRDLPAAGNEADYFAKPWLVFCSPPYAFFVDRQPEMVGLVAEVMQFSPEESIVVVEADERFDFSMLPPAVSEDGISNDWDVRTYAPAVVGLWKKNV
jgi:16S rRNA (guanine966-N2)-methyltransferase